MVLERAMVKTVIITSRPAVPRGLRRGGSGGVLLAGNWRGWRGDTRRWGWGGVVMFLLYRGMGVAVVVAVVVAVGVGVGVGRGRW